jgi:uncharacterized protein (DUF2267 family)
VAKKRQIHREVSQAVRETQREEGKALPTPKEFIPLYHQPAEKKTKDKGELMKAKSKSGIEKAVRVDKVIKKMFKQTKANISVGQLLEIAPDNKKKSWPHYKRKKRRVRWGPLISIM